MEGWDGLYYLGRNMNRTDSRHHSLIASGMLESFKERSKNAGNARYGRVGSTTWGGT
jgi:hypothetical protein